MIIRLLKEFVEEVICFEKALNDVVQRIDPEYAKGRDFSIGFEGSFGSRHVNPRILKSQFLGNLVCCEGIVTKCNKITVAFLFFLTRLSFICGEGFLCFLGSVIRPKVVKSVHFCPATKKTLERKYTDLTSYNAFPTSAVYPTEVV